MMRKHRKDSARSNKNKFIVVAIGIAIVVVGAGIAISMRVPASPSVSDSRTIPWLHVHGLGIDPSESSILYIATHGDFYQSMNGAPPVKVDKVGADYMAFNAPPKVGHPLYASGHPSMGGNTGLIRSTDGGQTWERVSNVLEPPVDFHAMAVSKSDPNIIIGFDSAGRGLFRTVDSGKTWEMMEYPDYVLSLAISPQDSQMVFAGTRNGIFQSTDAGHSWIHLDEYKGTAILALSFDEDGVIYASGKLGLSKSFDLGRTWEEIEAPALTITSIAVDSQNKIVYVAGLSSGNFQEVFRSLDDGKSWHLIGTNRQ
jgi:photosystem II stability/assembly factor-like uncharacterized protein